MAAQVVTKQTLIGEMLQMDMGIAAILMAAGMHCVGCPSSAMESLEEACMVHGMDADQVLKRINDYLANKEKYYCAYRIKKRRCHIKGGASSFAGHRKMTCFP